MTVETKFKVFVDTSALFSAVHSESGGERLFLKLGEAGAISLWIGPWVLEEAEAVLDRKSPGSKAYFVLLLDRSRKLIHTFQERHGEFTTLATMMLEDQETTCVQKVAIDYVRYLNIEKPDLTEQRLEAEKFGSAGNRVRSKGT